MNDPRIIAVLWDLRRERDTLVWKREETKRCAGIDREFFGYLDAKLMTIDLAVQSIFSHFPGLDLSEFQDAQ